MSTVMVPGSADQALDMLESAMGFLADADATQLPTEVLAGCLRALERVDAVGAAARGKLLAAFDAKDGHLSDGQRTARAWLVNTTRITRRQAGEHLALARLAGQHLRLWGGLREGYALTKSVALQLITWMADIPPRFWDQSEQILVTAAEAGADLAALAAIIAEIARRTAPADPDGKPEPEYGVSLDTTIDGAGLLRGNLSPECAALVRSVLDALSAPQGGEDLRTRPERYHDALAEAMRRLLASDLLPRRAGQPVKALVHIYFAELREMDGGSVLQDKWITEYRAAWAAHRAAASVRPGDGGAWLEGAAARRVACDAMLVPVVTGDIDPGAIERLIALCVQFHRLRTRAPAGDGVPQDAAGHEPPDAQPDATCGQPGCTLTQDSTAAPDGAATQPDGTGVPDGAAVPGAATHAEVLAMLEHQILSQVIQIVSGPGGVASFLRRNLLGKPLGGPSLPLDAGQTGQIPAHLRRLIALRDQGCGFPGGCDQPASQCEPHHVAHKQDGGPTSLTNLTDWCWFHHHVVLHQMGWKLIVHPDGTSQVTTPDGKIIHSHSPPPRPG